MMLAWTDILATSARQKQMRRLKIYWFSHYSSGSYVAGNPSWYTSWQKYWCLWTIAHKYLQVHTYFAGDNMVEILSVTFTFAIISNYTSVHNAGFGSGNSMTVENKEPLIEWIMIHQSTAAGGCHRVRTS